MKPSAATASSYFEIAEEDRPIERAANAKLAEHGMRCSLSRRVHPKEGRQDCILTVQYGSVRKSLARSYPFTDAQAIVDATKEWAQDMMDAPNRYADFEELAE